MNRLCAKQPLNKGHPYILYITAQILFPKGGRYRGVPLYTVAVIIFSVAYKKACLRHDSRPASLTTIMISCLVLFNESALQLAIARETELYHTLSKMSLYIAVEHKAPPCNFEAGWAVHC